MIHINRPKAVPAVFNAPDMKKARNEIALFYKRSVSDRSQQRLPYVQLSASTLKRLRSELEKLFGGKCAYCESTVGDVSYGDFDHFRPRNSARGLNKEFSNMHYGWLAYKWPNMYLSCSECNKHKINWFPVEGSRAKVLSAYNKVIVEEKTLFIDPCIDKPSDHLEFRMDGTINPLTKKGETTLELLNLNRITLVKRRKEAIARLEHDLRAFKDLFGKKQKPGLTYYNTLRTFRILVKQLGRASKHERVYCAFQRSCFVKWLEKESSFRDFILFNKMPEKMNPYLIKDIKSGRADIKKHISLFYKPAKSKPVTKRSKKKEAAVHTSSAGKITVRINIDRIEVKNFKAIEDLKIVFPESRDKNETWLMFLGENGVGKSSMLQAVALALMGSKYFAAAGLKLKPNDILRHETQEGYVRIYTRETELPVEMIFSSRHRGIRHTHEVPPSFLLAYGSTRLFKTGTLRVETSRGLVKTKNMFDPSYALADANRWIMGIKDQQLFDKVALAIKDLLLFGSNEKLVRRDGKLFIHYDHKPPDTLNELSDGYKSVIAVAIDIMKTLVQANTSMEAAEGIVLLDEIGTHLHPRWKMEVVKRFRNVFPRLQFIVTTHDPLCLKGLKKGEVIVFNKDDNHKIYIQSDLPDPGGLRADQLLSSEFFGLKSTISMEEEVKFNEYYELLRKKDRLSVSQQKRLESLKNELHSERHLGNSLREELAFGVVDELLAKEDVTNAPLNRTTLKDTTISMVQEMWDTIIKSGKNDKA